MKKLRRIILLFVVFLSIFTFNTNIAKASEEVYIGGIACGFQLNTKGVLVVGTTEVLSSEGNISPAEIAGIKTGDVILKINGKEINSSYDLENSLTETEGEVLLKREKEILNVKATPKKDLNGKLRLGLFVRNDVAGIGTITYVKGNRFGALGHTVSDANGEIVEITGGKIYKCNVGKVVKGEKGKPGELRGSFIKSNLLGDADKNLSTGVYGTIDNKNLNLIKTTCAKKEDITVGDAKIYSTICGDEIKSYDIKIIKVDFSTPDNRNFVIKITDKELIEQTGGIVQGMSGSPIVQNGKLIGAVTHVFINDPERGFGIFIDNMME
ncbi:MAG: SpoIVB peptidase [Clostridia bacterium]|nr:SpoIVB peptidase [Clostridia bacterium]